MKVASLACEGRVAEIQGATVSSGRIVLILVAHLLALQALADDGSGADRPLTEYSYPQRVEHSFLDETQTTIRVADGALIIPEDVFLRYVPDGFDALPERRLDAVHAAGAGNDISSLGVFGQYAATDVMTHLRGDIFIVVRNPQLLAETGYLLADDYYVAAVELELETHWYADAAHFALSATPINASDGCCNPERVCVPVGLAATNFDSSDPRAPPELVKVDNESSPFFDERDGQGLAPINLLIFSKHYYEEAFEFSCKVPAQPFCMAYSPQCDGLPVVGEGEPAGETGCDGGGCDGTGCDGGDCAEPVQPCALPEETYSSALPPMRCDSESIVERALSTVPATGMPVVISQHDFENAIAGNLHFGAAPETRVDAAKLGGAKNDPSVLGVAAALYHLGGEPIAFSGDLFIVATSAFMNPDKTRVEVESFYIAAVKLEGVASWLGNGAYFGTDTGFSAGSSDCCGKPVECIVIDMGGGAGPCLGAFPSSVSVDESMFLDGSGLPPGMGPGGVQIFDNEMCGFEGGGGVGTAECLFPVIQSCAAVMPNCSGGGGYSGYSGGGGGATLPGSDGCTGGGPERTIYPTEVPKICTQISSFSGLASQCGGYCYSCEVPYYQSERQGLPPGCATYKPEPGSDLCSPTSDVNVNAVLDQVWASVQGADCGDVGGAGANGGICCGKDCLCVGAGSTSCGQCVATGECHVVKQGVAKFNPLVAHSEDESSEAPVDEEEQDGYERCVGTSATCTKDPFGPYHELDGKEDLHANPEQKRPSDTQVASSGPPTEGVKGEPGVEVTDVPPPYVPGEAAMDRLADMAGIPSGQTEREPSPTQVTLGLKASPQTAGDPVLLGDGSLDVSVTDLQFQGPVRPFVFSRTYNSRSAYKGSLGSNWTHNWEVYLQELRVDTSPSWAHPYCKGGGTQGATCLILWKGSLAPQLFIRDPRRDLFLPMAGSTDTIARTTGRGWALRTAEGQVLTFDEDGFMSSDTDRFGNSFEVESEPTPLETLRRRYCQSAGTTAAPGVACQALNSMLRLGGSPYPNSPGELLSSDFVLPEESENDPQRATLAYARSLFNFLLRQNVEDSPAFGSLRKRPKVVRDPVGREFVFSYYKAPLLAGAAEPSYDFEQLPSADLIERIDAPTGVSISFEYDVPANYPKAVREAFLIRASRGNSSASPDPTIIPVQSRHSNYRYAWSGTNSGAWDGFRAEVEKKYFEYYRTFVGCFYYRDMKLECADPLPSLKITTPGDPAAQARRSVREYLSSIADNVVEIENSGTVEVESHYVSSPFSPSFDQVSAQRFGSSSYVLRDGLTPSSAGGDAEAWRNPTLPKVVFEYAEAGAMGHEDRTETFLPAELAARFPLEASPDGGTVAHAPPRLVGDTTLFTVQPEDLVCTKLDGGCQPACDGEEMLAAELLLPGHRPVERYSPGGGAAFEHQLQRSRISCDAVARAHLWDVTHNDVISGYRVSDADAGVGELEDGGFDSQAVSYEFETIVGGRRRLSADVNRICRWAKVIDRDGDVEFYGLNYRGQSLVVATYDSTKAAYSVREQLYNADGLPTVARNPTWGGQRWTVSAGYSVSRYEEYNPTGNKGWNGEYPLYWSKRGNLLAREVYSGSSVEDYSETGMARTFSAGRYEAYKYEPIFNQVVVVETGLIRKDLVGGVPPEYVAQRQQRFLVDYQELNFGLGLDDLLLSLEPWGARWARQSTASDAPLDQAKIAAYQLPIPLGLGDLNKDGVLGFFSTSQGAGRGRGVPVREEVVHRDETGVVAPIQGYLTIIWSPHGKPSLLATGSLKTRLRYYNSQSTGTSSPFGGNSPPAGAAISSGFRGFLAEVEVDRYPERLDSTGGPPDPPCRSMPGPYQWLLPGSCSSDPTQELRALGLSDELVADILATVAGEAGAATSKTAFSYNMAGAVNRVWRPEGMESLVRDTDGRVEEVYDLIGNRTDYGYDVHGNMLSLQVFDSAQSMLSGEYWTRDEEGRATLRCAEQRPGECLAAILNQPAKAFVERSYFSGEGLLVRQVDNAGLELSYGYDGRKLPVLTSAKDLLNRSPSRTWVSAYDSFGRIEYHGASGGGGSGLMEYFTYDGLGRLVHRIDARGYDWHYAHSSRDLLVEVKRDDYGYPSTGVPPRWRVGYGYDPYGRMSSKSLNGAYHEVYSRDYEGQVVSRLVTGGGREYFTYDSAGQLAWVRSGNGDVRVQVSREGPTRRSSASLSFGGVSHSPLVVNRVEEFREDGALVSASVKGGGANETTIYSRNALGDLVGVQYPDGRASSVIVNAFGWIEELRELSPGGDEVSIYSYSPRGDLVGVTDPSSQLTSFIRDGFGSVVEEVLPGVGPLRLTFDKFGRIRTREDGRGNVVDLRYDAKGDAVEEWVDGQKVAWRTFDDLGRLTASTYGNPAATWLDPADREVSATFVYDDLGRISAEGIRIGRGNPQWTSRNWSIGGGVIVGGLLVGGTWKRELTQPGLAGPVQYQSTFDAAGRRMSQAAGGGRVEFSYLGRNVVARTQDVAGRSPLREHIELDALGRAVSSSVSAIDLRNGLPVDAAEGAAYCGANWDPTVCGVPIHQEVLRRDVGGKISLREAWTAAPVLNGTGSQQSKRQGQGQDIAYDPLGRLSYVRDYFHGPPAALLDANAPQTAQSYLEWSYEREPKVGSTSSVLNLGSLPPKWRHDGRSRNPGYRSNGYALNGGTSIVLGHDLSGNVSTIGAWSLNFDFRNQLSSVVSMGEPVESYLYDESGRIAARWSGTSPLESYVYDGDQIVAAQDDAGHVKWEASWGPDTDQLIEFRTAGGTFASISDHRNNVRALWNGVSGLSSVAEYDPQGRVTVTDDSGGECVEYGHRDYCGVYPELPFGFASALRSDVTGLVYMRARWYSTELGEFLSADPLGYVDSFNVYAYVGFDPVNGRDPFGMQNTGLSGFTPATILPPTPQPGGRIPTWNPWPFPNEVPGRGPQAPTRDRLPTPRLRPQPPRPPTALGFERIGRIIPYMAPAAVLATLLLPSEVADSTCAGGRCGERPPDVAIVEPGPSPGLIGDVCADGACVRMEAAEDGNVHDKLMPGGQPIGHPGRSEGVREINGGVTEAEEFFKNISSGGTPVAGRYPGTLVKLPSGGAVGFRTGNTKSGPGTSATIDVNVPGVPFNKIKFDP